MSIQRLNAHLSFLSAATRYAIYTITISFPLFVIHTLIYLKGNLSQCVCLEQASRPTPQLTLCQLTLAMKFKYVSRLFSFFFLLFLVQKVSGNTIHNHSRQCINVLTQHQRMPACPHRFFHMLRHRVHNVCAQGILGLRILVATSRPILLEQPQSIPCHFEHENA